jgi:hypothetical protein
MHNILHSYILTSSAHNIQTAEWEMQQRLARWHRTRERTTRQREPTPQTIIPAQASQTQITQYWEHTDTTTPELPSTALIPQIAQRPNADDNSMNISEYDSPDTNELQAVEQEDYKN